MRSFNTLYTTHKTHTYIIYVQYHMILEKINKIYRNIQSYYLLSLRVEQNVHYIFCK